MSADLRSIAHALTTLALLTLAVAFAAEVLDNRMIVALKIAGFASLSGLICFLTGRIAPVVTSLAVFSITLNAYGWIWQWYHEIGWYDELTHTITTASLNPIVCYFLLRPFLRSGPPLRKWHLAFIAVLIGAGVGALWEIVEWLAYLQTDNPLIIKSLQDTITDMAFNVIGAFLGLGMFFRLARHLPSQNPSRFALHRVKYPL